MALQIHKSFFSLIVALLAIPALAAAAAPNNSQQRSFAAAAAENRQHLFDSPAAPGEPWQEVSLYAAAAQQQQNIHFETIQIDLWPEYDRQAMLVIYRATIAADVELPVDLTLRIPASAGEPNAVAVSPPDGQPLNADYERQVLDEWAYINLTANFSEVQIEYYDPSIVREGTLRTYTYHWPGDYAVDNVIMLVQQPTGALNVATEPRLTEITQDSVGLMYLQGEIGAMAADETFDITVSYEKETDDLTANFLPLESSAPLADDTPGRMSTSSALPWAMGILGLAIIFLGAYWYWSTGSRQNRRPRRKQVRAVESPKNRVPEPELHEDVSDEPSRFCHQCGKRALPSDKFCRSCGTKLRV